MKTIKILETTDELLETLQELIAKDDTIPPHARRPPLQLVFENDYNDVHLQGTEEYQLGDDITAELVIKALCVYTGFSCHIT